MEGTYLHRWQVTMTDGSLINQTGYIELAGQNSNDTIQPFTISPLAGILGIGLITLPLMTQFLMLPISFSSLSVEGARLKREASKRWLPIAGLAVIGLARGRHFRRARRSRLGDRRTLISF
jgi:hypothetical protein